MDYVAHPRYARYGTAVPSGVHDMVFAFTVLGAWCIFSGIEVVRGYDCRQAEECAFGAAGVEGAGATTGGGDTGSYVSHAVHVAALSRFTDAYACDDLNARVAAVREHLGIVPSEGRYTTACDKLVPLNPNVVIFVYIQLIVVATCVGLVAAKKL